MPIPPLVGASDFGLTSTCGPLCAARYAQAPLKAQITFLSSTCCTACSLTLTARMTSYIIRQLQKSRQLSRRGRPGMFSTKWLPAKRSLYSDWVLH
jgi:hypothetical protein